MWVGMQKVAAWPPALGDLTERGLLSNRRVANLNSPIRVSELAEFVYCRQARWLQMVEKESSGAESHEDQAKIQRWHREQSARIPGTDAFSGAGYTALLIAFLLLVIYGGEAARRVVPTSENLAWFAEVLGKVQAARGFGRPGRSHSRRVAAGDAGSNTAAISLWLSGTDRCWRTFAFCRRRPPSCFPGYGVDRNPYACRCTNN